MQMYPFLKQKIQDYNQMCVTWPSPLQGSVLTSKDPLSLQILISRLNVKEKYFLQDHLL